VDRIVRCIRDTTQCNGYVSPDWLLFRFSGHRTVPWVAPDCPVHHLTIGSSPSPGVGRSRVRRLLGLSPSPRPRVGRSGVRRLPGLSPSPSPGVGRSGVRRLLALSPSPSPGAGRCGVRHVPGLSPSPSPGVGRCGVRRLLGLSPSPSPGVGRCGVRRLPGLSPSPSPGSGEAELPMVLEAGLGCCQPHSVEWRSSRSGAGGAVLSSGRSVERQSDCGHFGSVD
jgi:hypothetical protein